MIALEIYQPISVQAEEASFKLDEERIIAPLGKNQVYLNYQLPGLSLIVSIRERPHTEKARQDVQSRKSRYGQGRIMSL
jgi:hypothetical protein